MDLITDLPKSDGFTAIVVFIDKLMKMVHLARCEKGVVGMGHAQIFVEHVFWLHVLPKVIIHDQDPCFIGKLY